MYIVVRFLVLVHTCTSFIYIVAQTFWYTFYILHVLRSICRIYMPYTLIHFCTSFVQFYLTYLPTYLYILHLLFQLILHSSIVFAGRLQVMPVHRFHSSTLFAVHSTPFAIVPFASFIVLHVLHVAVRFSGYVEPVHIVHNFIYKVHISLYTIYHSRLRCRFCSATLPGAILSLFPVILLLSFARCVILR